MCRTAKQLQRESYSNTMDTVAVSEKNLNISELFFSFSFFLGGGIVIVGEVVLERIANAEISFWNKTGLLL